MIPQRRVINDLIDLVWEEGKPRIYVAGKPFLFCAFLVANIDTSKAAEINSVDDIAQLPGAHALEGADRAVGISPEEQMWGFASSLIGWVESGYNTHAIHSNLAFPLLKELAKAGDIKAKKELQWGLIERLKEGNEVTTTVIVETCHDLMDKEAWLAIIPTLRDALEKQRENPRFGASRQKFVTEVSNVSHLLPDEVLWVLVQSQVGDVITHVMENFVVDRVGAPASNLPFTGREREWLKAALGEISKNPKIYMDAVKSAIHWSLVAHPGATQTGDLPVILSAVMEDVVSRNTDHQYDELVEAGANKVGHGLLLKILDAALFTRLTKVEYRTPAETRVKILAKVIENPAASLSMVQQVVDNVRFIDGSQGIIYQSVYRNNTRPGLDITPRNRNEKSYHEHVVDEKPFAGYHVSLRHSLSSSLQIIDAFSGEPTGGDTGRKFAMFKDKVDLALLSIKPTGRKATGGDVYHGKVTCVEMQGAAKGFDNWGKRNGWTHCLYADGYPKPRLTDAWFKRGFIYYLAQGTPRNQYYYDKDVDKLVKE